MCSRHCQLVNQTDLQRPIQTKTMTEEWFKTIWRHFSRLLNSLAVINEDFVNNFEDSDPRCAAAIADQQTKPIFNAPFKPKQWPRRGSRQFGDIFLHTKVGMSAIYSLTTKPQATDFFRQFVYLLTEQKPGTKTFWFYKGILLIFFLKNVVVTLNFVNVQDLFMLSCTLFLDVILGWKFTIIYFYKGRLGRKW